MKKFMMLAIGAAALYYVLTGVMAWHSGVTDDLYRSKEEKAQRVRNEALEAKAKLEAQDKPAVPLSVSSRAPVELVPEKNFVTKRVIKVYSTIDPSHQLGTLGAGTSITIIGRQSLMTVIRFANPKGQMVEALSRPEDVM